MPNAFTHLWTMCPPDEFEANYLKCSCSSGMDFLGALQRQRCQGYCQSGPEAAGLLGKARFSGRFASRDTS